MEDDPLMDEDVILPPQFTFTPIRALRPSTRFKISQFLDLDGVLVVINELDVVNNFNGLAELIGFSYLEIKNIGNQKSPTKELLDQWTVKEQCENATIGNLWTYLYQMERYDVLKDCRTNLLNDCRVWEDHRQNAIEAERYRLEKLDQDPKVSNSDMAVDETKMATLDDVKTGAMTTYDAFICYEIDDDLDRAFVKEMIKELEQERERKSKSKPPERNLKLFVPGRDDLPGSAAHTINAYLIEKRCRRMIILMSNAFLKSSACDFQTKFAHALAPGARSKKLIPVIREKGVPLPRILKFLAVCDFTKSDMKEWVWDRLYTAIIAPIPRFDSPDYIDSESCSIEDLRELEFSLSSSRRLEEPDPIASMGFRGAAGVENTDSQFQFNPANANTQNASNPETSMSRKPSKVSKIIGSFKKTNKDKDPKKSGAKSVVLNPKDIGVVSSRDYLSMPQHHQNPSALNERLTQCDIDDTVVNADDETKSQPIPKMRKPVENVDSTRRISSESITMGTPPTRNQSEHDMPPPNGFEHRLTRPTRSSSDCDEVSSSTSDPVFV